MKPKKIVITGGPGTGKSSVIRELETTGYRCFHEVIRSMTSEAKQNGNPMAFKTNPLAFVPDPYGFNTFLLKCRVGQFLEASALKESLVFFDRGIPDVLAYMDFFGQAYGSEFRKACEEHRYDQVFLLHPWEEIYISDNERLESFEEAVQIHGCLLSAYRNLGYEPISVPEGPVSVRANHILKELSPHTSL